MTGTEVLAETRQIIIDEEHLRLLVIGHYIMGALYILFSSVFIFHLVFFLFIANNPEFFPSQPNAPQPPSSMFRFMGGIVGGLVLLGWAFGGLNIYIGRCIRRRTKRVLAVVVACLNLIFMPVGTMLGVATLLVLNRSGVKPAYEVARPQ